MNSWEAIRLKTPYVPNLIVNGESIILTIFICKFDLFKQGRYRYTFEHRCIEDTNIRLSDGTTRIFLNTKGILASEDISEDLRAFLEYVEGVASENPFIQKVTEEIEIVKSNKKLRGEYMNQVVRDQLNKDEGIRIGLEQGLEQGKGIGDASRVALQIMKKVQKSKPLEVIADELECTPTEIYHLYELIIQGGPECTVEDILEEARKNS